MHTKLVHKMTHTEIKKRNGKMAVLISFDTTGKFESAYERNRFFRGLYGWKQTIKKESRIYSYHRKGILSVKPHIKVDNSVFIIAKKHEGEIVNYMNSWEDKVKYKTFKVLLGPEETKRLNEG